MGLPAQLGVWDDKLHDGGLLRLWQFFTKRRGDRRWDLFLRATAVAGVIGIPIVLLFPSSVPLVWLVLIGVPANGPLSPILPTTFDPLIMEVGKYTSALSATLAALGVYMYMEFVNWHIYAWVLDWQRLANMRANRVVRWGVGRFARAPVTTILFFAMTPVPFWVVRCLAILHDYPIMRFMVATAVGRFPRFFMYAWLGAALSIPTFIIIAVIVAGAAVAIGARLVQHRPILADTILDGGDRPAEADAPAGFPREASLAASDAVSRE